MRKRRLLRKRRRDAIVDMDDFLVTYGAEILGINHPQLSKSIANAASNGLRGLDTLFHDNGFGRTQKFFDIGEGFINDAYGITGDQAHQMAIQLSQEAIRFLGTNAQRFDHWKRA